MIREMSAEELEAECPTYVALRARDIPLARRILEGAYRRVELDEEGFLRVWGGAEADEVVAYLYKNGVTVSEVSSAKISLEEYYIELMKEGH